MEGVVTAHCAVAAGVVESGSIGEEPRHDAALDWNMVD